MKKYIKDISIFVMGIITATSIGVAAYTISAKEIGYSPKDSSWKVNNVADAIESLKTLKGGSQNYSLDEQVVGTWIDGKPLYQKTLDIGTLSSNDTTFSLSSVYGLTNIEHAWKVSGYLVNSGGWEYDNFYLSASDHANISVFNTTIRVICSGYANVTGGKVTIQYTKTSDSVQSS